MGIEPITYHLQGDCSTVELRRQYAIINLLYRAAKIIPKPDIKGKVYLIYQPCHTVVDVDTQSI